MLPTSDSFWLNEDNLLWGETDELALSGILAGAKSGAALLPPGAQQLINQDLFNQGAITFLQEYNLTTIPGINNTTRRKAVEVIGQWLTSGDSLQTLEGQLAPLFGSQRAAMIASTETTRMFAVGNEMIWNSTGLIGAKQWRTARDERVCPICGPLDGKITGLNGVFELTNELIAGSSQMKNLLGTRYNEELAERRANSLINSVGVTILHPPAHPRCLPGAALVLPIGGVSAGSERWYEGDMVTVVTSENPLTVTPNHPVLTDNGWVGAGHLTNGDNIIGYNRSEWEASLVGINDNYIVSSIKDVFGSLDLGGFRMPVSPPDFHNDGAGSDVAIIRPNSKVMGNNKPTLSQPLSEFDFLRRNIVSQVPLSRFGSGASLTERNLSASGGIMGGADLMRPLACGHPFPLDTLGFGLGAGGKTSIDHVAPESMATDPKLFREFVLAFPGTIAHQKVIEVRNNHFSGHVYNLQTDSGMYIADGIITHNCRCWESPVVSEDLFRDEIVGILNG